MTRGADAQFKFILPYKFSELNIVKITFWQPNNSGPSSDRPLPITKVLGQCSACQNPNELSVVLNSEETLRFDEESKAFVQLRAETESGISIVSKEKQVTVYPVYDDTLIDDGILPTPTYDGLVYLDGGFIV